MLEKEDTPKYRGVYFLEFRNLAKLDLLEKQAEIVQNIRNCIRKGKAVGCVKKIRKSNHRRNVFITHDFNLGLFDGLCSDKIIEIIEKKNQKHAYYDRSLDECWLVIVSDMNSLASRYTFIQNKENLQKIQSPFDKIFHLENLCGNLTNIK
ncbi:hypothetical protein SDC9_125168 [bioreactor metagenome]|uniref:Uncharacterized protein n=1 Tax=bioreactor metagenome TaxID=1076179 RepID=A0A645CMM5_9ZZZZ